MQSSDIITYQAKKKRQSPGNTDKYYSQPNHDIKDYIVVMLCYVMANVVIPMAGRGITFSVSNFSKLPEAIVIQVLNVTFL